MATTNYLISRRVTRAEERSLAKAKASADKVVARRQAGRALQKRSVLSTSTAPHRYVAMTAVSSISNAFGMRDKKRGRVFA